MGVIIMSKTFHRIISFEVEGEIYDHSTSPEDILKSYDWHFKGFHDNHEDKCFLESSHDNSHGRITKVVRKNKIGKTDRADTETFTIKN
jgi:hypothetical protein